MVLQIEKNKWLQVFFCWSHKKWGGEKKPVAKKKQSLGIIHGITPMGNVWSHDIAKELRPVA